METKIIFIGNYKGGVGKTTSALNFAEYFHAEKNKVLVLDLDPQSSLSEILIKNGGYGMLNQLKPEETLNYVFDLYITKIKKYNNIDLKFSQNLIKKYKNTYDFVPSSLFYRDNLGLDSLALLMEDNIQYLSILKIWIDTVKCGYNYIFIDCPPSNNLITRSAFLMSDYYIIPTILDGLSTNGVIHYIKTIKETYHNYCEIGEDALIAKHFFGKEPELIGIFYNLIRGQVNYEDEKKDFEDELDKSTPYGKQIILNSQINNYIAIARSTENGKTAPIDKEDFKILTTEIIQKIQNK